MQADPFVIYDQPPFPILEALNLDSSFVIFLPVLGLNVIFLLTPPQKKKKNLKTLIVNSPLMRNLKSQILKRQSLSLSLSIYIYIYLCVLHIMFIFFTNSFIILNCLKLDGSCTVHEFLFDSFVGELF